MVSAQGSDVLEGGEDDNRLFGGGAGNVGQDLLIQSRNEAASVRFRHDFSTGASNKRIQRRTE